MKRSGTTSVVLAGAIDLRHDLPARDDRAPFTCIHSAGRHVGVGGSGNRLAGSPEHRNQSSVVAMDTAR